VAIREAISAARTLTFLAVLSFVLSSVALYPSFPQPVWAASDTTGPTISITSPSNGATVSGTVLWSADITDVSGVHNVLFYVDGNPYTTFFQAPYTVGLSTVMYSNAQHTLMVIAYDSLGNEARASITITISNPDTTGPITTIYNPLAGATVSGTIDYRARASDVNGVTKVEFYVDTTLIGTDTTPEYNSQTYAYDLYRVSWNSASAPNGSHTLMVKSYDKYGNVGSRSITVTVSNGGSSSDTTSPVLTVPSAMTVEATSASGAIVTFTVTATDNIDGSLTAVCTPASGSTFPITTTTVNCSATDAAGNTGTASFTITVRDTTAPTLTLPSNIIVEATSASGRIVTFTATATDLVDGTRSVSCTPASGSTFPLGITTVNCSTSDTRGNTASGSFTVTVRDTTKPSVSVPADMTVAAPSSSGTVVTFTATATDFVDGSITPVCTPASGSTFPVGTTTVTCSATDSAGNTGTASFLVTVTFVDTTPPPAPVISSPASGTATNDNTPTFTGLAEGSSTVKLYDGSSTTPIATTTATSTGTWSATPSTAMSNGVHSITATATDAAGNTSPASAAVSITIDTVAPSAPVISSPASGTTTNDSTPTFSGSAEASSTVRVYDGTSTTPIVTVTATSTGTWSATPSTALTNGVHSITAKATDKAGNTSPASSAISITIDTVAPLAPTISSPSSGTSTTDTTPTFAGTAEALSTVRLYDGTNTTPIATATATSTGTWSATPTTGLSIATHSVTAKATDAAGNTSPASTAVSLSITSTIVADTTPPVLTLPSSITVEATSASGAVVTYTATATDNVDGSITPVCSPASGSTFPLGTTTVLCSATDSSGNIASGSFTITVKDSTAPAVTITSPTTGQTISGTTSVSTSAIDTVGLSYVELYIDGSFYGRDTASPYGFSVDTSTLSNGGHQFTAKAVDKQNNAAISPAVQPMVENTITPTPPTVLITSPSDGSTVKGIVSITVTVSDSDGISKLDLYIDGQRITTLVPVSGTTSTTFTFNWDSTSVSNAWHTITATGFDTNGASSSDSISVKVQNKGGGGKGGPKTR
jgi:large repetitive protein